MDEDDWDPTPPHGVRGGYEKFPGYESVSGETGKPRLAPRPPAPTSGTTSGYDFKNISNSPLYRREHARPTPPYTMTQNMKIDDDGAKGLGSASLTLGIIGLVLLVFGLGTNFFCSFLSLILSIIGISLGSSSLTKYKRTGATYGKGNAVAGVVINAIVLGLFLVGLLFGMLLIGLLSMAGG